MTTKIIDYGTKKRYAIISDIHWNIEGLDAILDDIKIRKINEIICLGDIIDLGPNSKECVDKLIDMNIKSTLWNHELYLLRWTCIEPTIVWEEKKHYEWVKNQLWTKEIEYLQKCPLYYELNIKNSENINKKIILAHYLIKDETLTQPFEKNHLKRDINLWIKYNNKDTIYVLGHVHNSFDINQIEWINNDLKEANELANIKIVASAGCSKDNYVYYAIIEIDKDFSFENIKVNFDRETFVNKIVSTNFPDKENIKKIFYGL